MTREEARKAAEVMLAYANGDEIEHKPRCGNGQWIKFTASNFNWITNEYRIKPKGKFDPHTLQPFDKVLVFNRVGFWCCDYFSYIIDEDYMEDCILPYMCVGDVAERVVPYNDETKHLVGTSEEAPEFYRYWEE